MAKTMNDLPQGLSVDLPFDILTLIPSYLTLMRDVLSFSLVCKIWYDALSHSNISIPVTINNTKCFWNLNLTHIILNPYINWSHNKLKKFIQRIKQKQASKIISLDISDIDDVSDEIIKCFMEKCSKLQYIDFSNSNVTTHGVKHLSNCSNLHTVIFRRC